MNTERSDGPASRWVRDLAQASSEPTEQERKVLGEVLRAMRQVRHGTLTLAVQDGKVVQLDVTEKRRF